MYIEFQNSGPRFSLLLSSYNFAAQFPIPSYAFSDSFCSVIYFFIQYILIEYFCPGDPMWGALFTLGNEEQSPLEWWLGKVVKVAFSSKGEKGREGPGKEQRVFQVLTQCFICLTLINLDFTNYECNILEQIIRWIIYHLYKTTFKKLKSSIYMK